MRRRAALALPLALAGGVVLAATSPDEILDDPEQEARARKLGKQLRCLVCQNQSIDDSNAELAQDLRRLVREQIVAGKSDREILDFLTERYGDFVLLKPPINAETWGLWFGPLAVFLIAGTGLALYMKKRRQAQPIETAPLSDDERRRVERLAREDGGA